MGKFIDLTGQKFGNLTVLNREGTKYGGAVAWKCLCKCGKEVIAAGNSLRTGHTKSCGCLNYNELKGRKFGKLTVIERAVPKKPNKKHTFWKCKCECGNEIITSSNHLLTGHTRSCGCSHKELTGEKNPSYKHGKRNSRLYTIWAGMKSRCLNKENNKYKNYGGRGIKLCDEWTDKENGFINFYNWAINNGYNEKLTLDRRNVNGDYCPENCRWLTLQEQNWNKINTIKDNIPNNIVKILEKK